MTVESAYCERIGAECRLKKQAIAARDMHTLTSGSLKQHNESLRGRAARAFSGFLPFVKTLDEIPTQWIDDRRERYDEHIAQPCEDDVCAMTVGLEKI
ncbi:MAG TPA: hypothetical protein VFX79_03460 [Candidatus Saccharimonadales bacterium]|nr:hypothetical protein [Candidatus Saccharimonadales bacterium]